ncbi:IPT/TIG domain-containing protein [uncultured Cyclobacterium sp.]|uniref:IPT/TIG domain-containing protein n=1 Tax=uncultured Cyclobacterium sp. TaxID=453820 RepID=UPI0030EE5735|tara:strand:- start:27096 stop:28043 length:948 start_codon:yes stop_codon:yes gene_type:complete
MKRHLIFIALLVSSLISACEQVELSPRTNPRFSVTSIQKIDETGVEFVSNIYDFGTEEIIVYGFLYSLNIYPIMDNSEVISKQGRPEDQFSMKVEQSLIKGESYAVVAFIQTTTERVYSEPIGFVSQGAPGFTFERFEYKSPVFYGDTITVKGSRLSKLTEKYAVRFQNQDAKVINIEENSFQFIIPEFYEFNTSGNGPDYFDVTLQVLDKTIPMNVNIPFQDAEFEERDIQLINYGGSVELTGNYLKDNNLKIATSTAILESIYSTNVTIEYAGNDKIVFKPKTSYSETPQYLTLEIRGKIYSLGNKVFEFKTP